MATDADNPATELNEDDGSMDELGAETVDAESYSEADGDSSAVDYDAEDDLDEAEVAGQPRSRVRLAMVAGLAVVVGLSMLVGWLGFTVYQQHRADDQRELFVQVARQGALNLTTIDWQHADADVKRVLDSATGTFYDDFAKRQQPFIEVVKKAQATSKGTITEAALESESGDEAQVLVAVSVKTSNIGAADQEPRAWRMRLAVQKSGDQAKISNVAFVP
jgi:Mce-associated membrane protein